MEPSENNKRSRDQIVRWVAILPGAVLMVILALYPIHWIVLLQFQDTPYGVKDVESILSPLTIEYFARAFFAPLIFIITGSKIAPKYKLEVGIALAVVFSCFYGYGANLVIEDIQNGLYSPSRWLRLAITVFLSFTGIAVGLLQAHKESKQDSSNILPSRVIDASDYEHAIPVSTVDEEYAWIEANFPKATTTSQEVHTTDGGLVDVLEVQLVDGSTRKLYFNMNGILAKWVHDSNAK